MLTTSTILAILVASTILVLAARHASLVLFSVIKSHHHTQELHAKPELVNTI